MTQIQKWPKFKYDQNSYMTQIQIWPKFIYDFWRIYSFLEDFQIFGKFLDFWKIFRFLENFQIFGKFSHFWETTKTILGLVTFEILITILTIENLNSWQSLLSDNKLWHWTAFAILAMFLNCFSTWLSLFLFNFVSILDWMILFVPPVYHPHGP